jgi:hypothetical protein
LHPHERKKIVETTASKGRQEFNIQHIFRLTVRYSAIPFNPRDHIAAIARAPVKSLKSLGVATAAATTSTAAVRTSTAACLCCQISSYCSYSGAGGKNKETLPGNVSLY